MITPKAFSDMTVNVILQEFKVLYLVLNTRACKCSKCTFVIIQKKSGYEFVISSLKRFVDRHCKGNFFLYFT